MLTYKLVQAGRLGDLILSFLWYFEGNVCNLGFDLIWFFTSTQQSFSYAGRFFLGLTSTKLG